METSAALRRAVEEFYRTCVQASPRPRGAVRQHHLRPGLSHEAWGAAQRAYQLLGKGSAYLGPYEVADALGDLAFRQRPEDGPDAFAAAAIEALMAQPARWTYEVPVLRADAPWLACALEPDGRVGEYSDPKVAGVGLSGQVAAMTRLGARVLAEERGLAWIGAAFAVGLVDLYFDPVPQCHAGMTFTIDGVLEDHSGEYLGILDRAVMSVPDDLTEVEQRALGGDTASLPTERHVRLVRRALAGRSDHERQVLTACRLLSQAATAVDFGVAVALAFTLMEGILLEPSEREDVGARLAEAAAHALGRSAEERRALRRRVRALYSRRSAFIHRGAVREAAEEREDVMDLARRVIGRELSLLG